ncbi:hypothetical protein KIL84_010566 [Mauremys mutica]|uniref:Uncharacterized protein n=1 Tax=Mauremys mutica TaxID=74926 RepID=A0A9D4B124_9SAUR|nr:hypothetical protein KIL84_010566 [Mauremys mutica]
MVCTTTGQSVDSSKLILQMHQKDVLPSVKAGGMRIVQKHPHTPDAKEEKDKDDQEWESSRGNEDPIEDSIDMDDEQEMPFRSSCSD